MVSSVSVTERPKPLHDAALGCHIIVAGSVLFSASVNVDLNDFSTLK